MEDILDTSADNPAKPLLAPELHRLAAYKTYRRRWYLLGVICLLNCSSAMLWLSFAPVADKTADYFQRSPSEVNWLSLVYLIITIPFGLLTTWILDTTGLKFSVILSSWLNMIGSVIRFLSTVDFIAQGSSRYLCLLIGQCFCATAQPLVLFSPTKLAALWFPEHQRATANMISSMSNPLGVLIANLLSPFIVQEKKYIPLMLGLYAIPPVVACVLASVGICEKAPPVPPSASSVNSTSEPFISGLKKLLKNKAYIILMVCFGAGIGIFTCFSALLEQFLCVMGYSNFYVGICGALFILFGIIGALLLGLYVDMTKKFTEVTKICFCVTALTSIGFALASQVRNQMTLLAVVCSLFGLFGFSIYPICMELSVESSYPVGEGTSTGLIFISGQIQGIIYMVLFQLLARPLSDTIFATCNVDGVDPLDWKVSILVMAGICSFGACCFVLFFHTDYKRLHADTPAISVNRTERETATS
ncbi:solute carrier family 49 member A3 [Microcaecilia unicolor]|uniref:Solute carrier family 49 member A3 n=1 Tax=Microcaecilia unicolor TaxID=1415580 RepID=A0A6P7XCF5_9AMPH|nr:solute carrier family 49 member A3 [Microcaecilia unicolor]XP_030050209.1 solute carrier family 49 member A3 [Microcaecilia unicolor]